MPRILCLLFCLSWSMQVHSQRNPQPHFRNYGTEHGLPSPEVHCAFEDSRGYMWFGTDNGVARFDGYDFKTYDAEQGLMSNVVFDVHEDGKGRIWFGTMTGEIFILEGDTILPYLYNYLIEELSDKFSGAGFMHLSEDETTYSLLSEFGIAIIDSSGNLDTITNKHASSYIVFDKEEFDETIMVQSNRRDWDLYDLQILKGGLDSIFILDIISEDYRYNTTLPRYNNKGKSGESKKLLSGELLIQISGYLHCLKNDSLKWVIPYEERITHILEDSSDKSIWFCLGYGEGIRKYEDITSIRNASYNQFLKGLSITKIDKDRTGNFWITSIEKGIFYSSNTEIKTYDENFGLSTKNVSSVCFKDNNSLFLGCENGDLFEINVLKNELIDVGDNGFGRHNFSILYENEKLWYGGMYIKNGIVGGMKYWDYRTKKLELFTSIGMDNLQLNKDGYLLTTNNSLGLQIFNPSKEIITYNSDASNNRGRIYGLHSDHANRLWVGTKDGLHEFIDSSYVHVGVNHPAFHHRVEDIHQFQDSTLVFGAKGYGVIVWKEGEEPLQITKKDGLTSNMLEDVHVCENNILWAGTLNGLNKITFENGQPKVRRFTMANGLPSNEITQIKSYEGQVWLCTSNGLVKFKDKEINDDAPAPIIQSIRVNNKIFSPKNVKDLAYNANNLTFEYLTINYRQNGQIPYRYRLGKDEEWLYTQNRTVNYSKLSKGTYSFEVQAQNEDGFWSESTFQNVTILPPWWETWWFRLLALTAIVGALWQLYQYRVRQIQKETDLKNQMETLEKSALQAQMNPHFIFNCLNSIQNFILKNDKKRAVEFLSRFARLVRHNLNASVKGKVTLEEEVSLLDNYLALERERFDHKFDYKITVADDLDQAFVEFPPLLIQPYIENAVIHGISQKEQQGKIEVSFRKENSDLVVEVKDNGAGFRKKKNGEIVNKSRHKSVGMSITRKRLELLGENMDDTVIIDTDNKNDNGTTVLIRLKTQSINS